MSEIGESIIAGYKAKTRSGWGVFLPSIVIVVSAAASSFAAPTTRPTAQMTLAADAYSHLKSLSDSGTIELNADVDGQQAHRSAEFISAFGGNNHFRHEVKQDVIASCNGEKIYVFHPTDNLYTEAAAPDDGTIPDDVRRLLEAQDLSLALALSGDVSGELLLGATSAADEPDGTIHVSYADRDVTLTLDPKTHLLRQVLTDESRGLRAGGRTLKRQPSRSRT